MHSVSWPSRLLGLLLVLLVLIMALGQGVTEGLNPLLHPTTMEVALLACLLVMLAAVIVSWRWEIVGAFLGVAGFLAFWIINLLSGLENGINQVLPVFPLMGLLFVVFWWRRHAPGAST